MSRLVEHMATDIDEFFNDAGEEITYISGDTSRTILAMAEVGVNDTKKTPHGLDRSYGDASFTLYDDPVKGITSPHAGDKIEYKGIRFNYVAMEQHVPNVVWRLRFLHKESAVPYGNGVF